MQRSNQFAILLFFIGILVLADLPAEIYADRGLIVDHHNEIVQVYLAPERDDGLRTLVFELKNLRFDSNQSLYGCVFVNGRIVQILEYGWEDSYIRGEVVLLEGEDEIIAYCGVLSSAPDRMDFFDYAPMWKTFRTSQHRPFASKIDDLPEWSSERNLIREKRLKEFAGE